jgi:tripartite-type tricarboxylate transporter receptor subunit TctC
VTSARIFLLLCSLLLPATAGAQSTDKPVRMLVGYAAGGGADVLARLLAPPLAAQLGQPFVVDNRPGAGGTIASALLAKSTPDGLTVYFSDASFVTAPGIYESLPYDPIAAFALVANVAALPLAYSVHPSVPATTPAELLALLKQNPDKYSYGTPGIGTLHHLSAELIKKQTGIRMTHVPYKGAAPALTDLIGGQIPLAVTSSTAALAQNSSGKLRVIGLTSRDRIPGFPNVAAMAEALPGFVATNDLFLIAPAGTPASVIARLSGALKTVLAKQELVDAYLAQGALIEWIGPEETSVRIARDITRWRTLAKEASIRAQ